LFAQELLDLAANAFDALPQIFVCCRLTVWHEARG